jgi:hypothetical protein
MVSVPSEHVEQREVVKWFRQTWPGVVIFAIPNGGLRNPAAALRLKVEGVLPGVPDLFVPEWRLWIEMKKAKGGITSKEQREMLLYLRRVGYDAIVCAGADEAKRYISGHATRLGVQSGIQNDVSDGATAAVSEGSDCGTG